MDDGVRERDETTSPAFRLASSDKLSRAVSKDGIRMQRDRDGRLSRAAHRTRHLRGTTRTAKKRKKQIRYVFLGFYKGSRHFYFSRASSAPERENNDTDVCRRTTTVTHACVRPLTLN